MALKKHGRQYDVVVFGATGYTGKYTAQHIATHLPTNLKWAVAGRSQAKLEEVVAKCRELNADRTQPSIEICDLDDKDLANLAQKTFLLITTVGPYGKLGEHAFKACAENGTHYLDVTGEAPFVARMIKKYEAAAKASGAIMIPQIGVESAPSDLVTWSLAKRIRDDLSLKTADVTVSIHTLRSAPSGGTLSTVLTLFDNFTFAELNAAHVPYALSPIPNPYKAPGPSLLTRLTGIVTVPHLGLLTTSIAARTDAAIVGRTWGLLTSRGSNQAYGPHFSFRQYMKARNWLSGLGLHFGLLFMSVLLLTVAPARRFLAKRVVQPGQGAEPDVAARDELEYRGVAKPDIESSDGKDKGTAFCKAWFHGPIYYLTGIFLAEGAATLLQDDHGLEGGINTPACLGQPFLDRLDAAGFHVETKILKD